MTTKRLILKHLQVNDVDIVYALRSNAVVNKFIIRPLYTNKQEATTYITKTLKLVKTNAAMVWVLFKTQTNQSIGTICLWNFSEDKKTAEIGYDLLPEFHGKGLMSEALQSVIKYGINKLNLQTIDAFTHKENISSKNLLKKNGFQYQSERIDIGFPHNSIYSISKL